MMSWQILIIILMILTLCGVGYLITRFHKFAFVQKMAEKHKALSWLVCLVPPAALGCAAIRSPYSAVVILLHLVLFWIAADLIGLIVRKISKKERRRYLEGALAILLTAVYLFIGWNNAHTVSRTEYAVHTEKALPGGRLRIAAISDAHLGVTLDGEGFAEEMARIQNENPDVVVVTGDFVDDSSRREDMVRACEALGALKTTYGVYFVLGNHDKGYYQGERDFTITDLRNELLKNHVVLLEDASASPDGSLILFGRKDRSDPSRAEIRDAARDFDDSAYQIILDHQPNDYAGEAAAGVDLVISGHTHGGHIWPAGYIGLLTGANDREYGMEVRDGTVFIVTSGISGWAIPFKTGTFSEYVVIDVQN